MREKAKKVRISTPIDVDKVSIRKDHYFSNAYIIDIPLESEPDHVWQDIFQREWMSSRHMWDRKLFVFGNTLRLITPPTEFEDKLNWVREVIERTNKAIDEINREAEAYTTPLEEQRKREVEEEKATIEMIRNMLRERGY